MKMPGNKKPLNDRRQKVQSVEVGMSILIALSRLGSPVSLSHLAQTVEMPPSKVHRYLRALIESGLVTQNEGNGLYRLGPEAMAIGFAAMQYLDIVSAAARPLVQLRDRIRETCLLSIWSNRGPAVVRIEPAPGAVVLNVRIGSILPIMISATGQVFAAFQKDQEVEDLLAAERDRFLAEEGRTALIEAEKNISLARERGLSSVTSTLTPGVSALAAPIFDHQGHIAGVFAALGSTGFFREEPDGPVAKELILIAKEVSEHLGWREVLAKS